MAGIRKGVPATTWPLSGDAKARGRRQCQHAASAGLRSGAPPLSGRSAARGPPGESLRPWLAPQRAPVAWEISGWPGSALGFAAQRAWGTPRLPLPSLPPQQHSRPTPAQSAALGGSCWLALRQAGFQPHCPPHCQPVPAVAPWAAQWGPTRQDPGRAGTEGGLPCPQTGLARQEPSC